jgi:exopolysaccharide biosynthesis protein
MALLKVPESVYGYSWPEQYLTTGFSFGEIVEHIEMARGVDYYGMKYLNADGKNVDVYVTVVSGDSEARFAAWAGDLSTIDDGKEVMDVKTVTQQAMLLERESGMRVLAASNGAFFQKSFGTNYPYTMRIIQGRMLCPPRLTPYPTRPANWIGVTYDGQVVTGNHDSYYAEWDGKLEYAVACGYHMLLDGKFNVQGVGNINPLTAVATTADGGFVLACADGRTDKSAGGTNIDMLGIFLDLEAIYPDIEFVDAYILDGGGSTEMVLDNPNGHTFITKNNPSDGKSRPIGDIIAVVIPK